MLVLSRRTEERIDRDTIADDNLRLRIVSFLFARGVPEAETLEGAAQDAQEQIHDDATDALPRNKPR